VGQGFFVISPTKILSGKAVLYLGILQKARIRIEPMKQVQQFLGSFLLPMFDVENGGPIEDQFVPWRVGESCFVGIQGSGNITLVFVENPQVKVRKNMVIVLKPEEFEYLHGVLVIFVFEVTYPVEQEGVEIAPVQIPVLRILLDQPAQELLRLFITPQMHPGDGQKYPGLLQARVQ